MSNNFFEALHDVATEKGISRDEIEEIVESAMVSAYKKQYPSGDVEEIKVEFDRDANSVMVVSTKMVVRIVGNPAEEIAYKQAESFKKDVELGDEIKVEENPLESFGRIAAQTAKQVIIQKIKEAEKNIIFNEFKEKEGELINGYLQRKSKDSLFVDLGKTEGILPYREQSPLEHYKTGDRIKALILDVQRNQKGSNIILTRAHPDFIAKIFEMEIPEVYDGVVNVVKVVREAGMRTKVAVASDRDDVDSVGACVGMRGVRILSIVRELENEKIDVVEYFDDKCMMAANALTPSQVVKVVESIDGGVIAVVEADQYKVAVGRGGHNARLASKLCGFEIDIKTEEQFEEMLLTSGSRAKVEELFSNISEDETPLSDIEDFDEKTIELLENGGIYSIEDLVENSYEDLIAIEGISEKKAQKILDVVAENVDFEENDEEYENEDENSSDNE